MEHENSECYEKLHFKNICRKILSNPLLIYFIMLLLIIIISNHGGNNEAKDKEFSVNTSITNKDNRHAILSGCNKNDTDEITIEDLNKIENLEINIVEDELPLWLSYCDNLKKLKLNIYYKPLWFSRNITSDLQELTLNIVADHYIEINRENFPFLDSLENTKLNLCGYIVDKGYLSTLSNLSEITISLDKEEIHPINFFQINNLSEIKIGKDALYTYAIKLDERTIESLEHKGVKFVSDDNSYEALKEVNKKLASIVNSLNLTEDSTDKENIDAVLIYILDNYQYSSAVSDLIKKGQDKTEEGQALIESFYTGGYLSAALKGDSNEIICGNYAALMCALLNRVPRKITNYYIGGNTHNWTMVKTGGKYYYLDPTSLDNIYERSEDGTISKVQYSEIIKNNYAQSVDECEYMSEVKSRYYEGKRAYTNVFIIDEAIKTNLGIVPDYTK